MDAANILRADLLDIIFEGRNKAYGAYELRKTYNRRVVVAIGIMLSICLLLLLLNAFGSKEKRPPATIVTTVDISAPPIKEKQPEVIPAPHQRAIAQQVKVLPSLPIRIVPDIDVDAPIPTQDDIANAQIESFSRGGTDDSGYVAPPVEHSTGGVEVPKSKDPVPENRFIPVEVVPKFPGGPEAWAKFLGRYLNEGTAAEEGAPPGQYTVSVQFVVDEAGNISNVEAIDVPKSCTTCGAEAVRVIRRSPHWEPAIQNGRPVKYQHVQRITFKVEE